MTSRRRVFITIKLGRPGLLIGKKGETIHALKDYLERVFKREVKIHIVDFDPFR